jgi:26S proteasome regulatory subunit N3
LYYTAIINAIQLNYSGAYENISQSLRRAPQEGAVGFRQHATKLLVVVQLLLGEIPSKTLFRSSGCQKSLNPYFRIAQAVRVGDLPKFMSIQEQYKGIFSKDKLYSLVIRLRHNVINAALKKISLAYSRISIKDVQAKLKLESESVTEYVIAKAIHDGVLDAVINRSEKFIYSREIVDVYSTEEPQAAFHRRIKFCLDIHNEAVKALRYPDDREEEKPESDQNKMRGLFEMDLDVEILEDKEDDDFME